MINPTTVNVATFTVNGELWLPGSYSLGTYMTPNHLCPDLLRLDNIGPADSLRGRIVRVFFWLMQVWPT